MNIQSDKNSDAGPRSQIEKLAKPMSPNLHFNELVELFKYAEVMANAEASPHGKSNSKLSYGIQRVRRAANADEKNTVLILCVDGRAHPNRAMGGSWGAWAVASSPFQQGFKQTHCYGKLGHVSTNNAGYLAILRGLEMIEPIVNALDMTKAQVHVVVFSRDDLVVNHVAGMYSARNSTFNAFVSLISCVSKMYSKMSYIALTEENKGAELVEDSLTYVCDLSQFAVSKTICNMGSLSIVPYGPSHASLVRVHIFGNRTVASHDVGMVTSAHQCTMIDFNFLNSLKAKKTFYVGKNRYMSLPKPKPFINIRQAHPLSLVRSKYANESYYDMTIVGTIRTKITAIWPMKKNNPNSVQSYTNWVNALVVLDLPVPIHLATRDGLKTKLSMDTTLLPASGESGGSFVPRIMLSDAPQAIPFAKEVVGKPYDGHQFWKTVENPKVG